MSHRPLEITYPDKSKCPVSPGKNRAGSVSSFRRPLASTVADKLFRHAAKNTQEHRQTAEEVYGLSGVGISAASIRESSWQSGTPRGAWVNLL